MLNDQETGWQMPSNWWRCTQVSLDICCSDVRATVYQVPLYQVPLVLGIIVL